MVPARIPPPPIPPETMTSTSCSSVRATRELRSAAFASCAVLGLSVATQLAFDEVLSPTLSRSSPSSAGRYQSSMIFTSAICALTMSLLIGRPTLRAIALITIWWCAVIAGSCVEIATMPSHPVYYLGTALRGLIFLGIGTLLTRIALRSCPISLLSNSHPIFPSEYARENFTVLHDAEESSSTTSPCNTNSDTSDDESSALLEKSLAARERAARNWYCGRHSDPYMVNVGGAFNHDDDNIVHVDFEDDIARLIMRSGGPLRHRYNQKHLPQVEIHVTVEVTTSYS